MKKFVSFPLKLYKGVANFTPSFYADEVALFGKNSIYNEFSDSAFFLAYKDGKPAGRVGVILNHAHNKKVGKRNARFTRFDVIDDVEVSRALFAAATAFAKSAGMDALHGPLGYTDLDREGMLVRGFEYPATYAVYYNHPYYNDHMKALGFEKEVDWLERRLFIPKEMDPKTEKVAEFVQKRYKMRDIVTNRSHIGKLVDRYGKAIFDLVDEAYSDLHGVVPLTQKVRDTTLGQLKLILSPRYISIVVNEKEELVGFGVAFPAMWDALNKSGGKLFPTGALRLIHALRHHDAVEFGLIAIKPGWQKLGVTAVIMRRVMKNLIEGGIQYAETNPMLETNEMIKNLWDNFENIQHKVRRCYIKKI